MSRKHLLAVVIVVAAISAALVMLSDGSEPASADTPAVQEQIDDLRDDLRALSERVDAFDDRVGALEDVAIVWVFRELSRMTDDEIIERLDALDDQLAILCEVLGSVVCKQTIEPMENIE